MSPQVRNLACGPVAGYTPAARDGLTQQLTEQGFTDQEITSAGWARRDRNGSIVDRFRRRVVFPICNDDGRVLGVTARDLTGVAKAKYLNTPTTVAYRKGETLYRPRVGPTPADAQVIVVEGPIDALAIASSRRGRELTEAVALCGTAMTTEHSNILAHLGSGPIAVMADGDDAGCAAAQQWLRILQPASRPTRLVAVPLGHDPASWVGSARREPGGIGV